MLRGMITVRAEFTNFAQPQSVVFHLRPERPSQVWSYDLAAIIHEAPVLARGAMFEGPLLLDAHR